MQDRVWRKAVLIPLWVIELIWYIVIAVFSGIDLSAGVKVVKSTQSTTAAVLSTMAVILLIMTLLSIIFVGIEIILFARHRLNPGTYLSLSCAKGAWWIFIFFADIIDAVRGYETGYSFIFTAPLFVIAICSVTYGAMVIHRRRREMFGGGYKGVETGGAGGYTGPGYESQTKGRYEPYAHQDAADDTTSASAPLNPFKDRSREPSPAAPTTRPPYDTPAPSAVHPAYRNSGDIGTFHNSEAAHQSYEMQDTAYKA